MEQQKVDLDALEAVLTSSTPGEARLLPNGGAGLEEDRTYWGVVGGKGYYHGAGAGGFCLTGFIDKDHAERLVASYNALPALIAELRELRAEVARLRWCEEMKADVTYVGSQSQWIVISCDAQPWRGRYHCGKTRNAAIDAAMKQEGK